MKRRHLLYLVAAALGMLFSVQNTGCSLIGLGVGAIVDSNQQDRRLVGTGEVFRVTPGTLLQLSMRDGSTIRGRYLGTGPASREEWEKRYAAVRATVLPEGPLPAPGDSIKVRLGRLRSLLGTFRSFGFESLELLPLGASEPVDVALGDVDQIVTGPGPTPRTLASESIVRALSDGHLPCLTAVLIETATDTARVAMDRIAMLSVPNARHAARDGFVIGLVADVMVVAVVVSQWRSDPWLGGGGCEGSTLGPMAISPHLRGLAPPRPLALRHR